MPRQIQHLAPFRGLDPTYVVEEAGIEGTAMRGGYNVEVLEGEWWVRHGLGVVSGNLGSIHWRWLVSGGADADQAFLVSGNWVIEIDYFYSRPGVVDHEFLIAFDIPYPASTTATVSFTQGLTVGTIVTALSGTLALGQIFRQAQGGGLPDLLYRIVALTGTTAGSMITIDRAWEEASGNEAISCYDPLFSNTAEPGSDPTNAGVVLFEQVGEHAANAMGYTHPAVTAGVYLVIYVAGGQAAVNTTDNTQVPITDFVRQTQLAVPTQVLGRGVRPNVFKDRLFFVGRQPDGVSDMRTIWYSRPLDFMQWHTGLQALGGTPNFIILADITDPITGMLPLGDTFVIHRRSSQDMLQAYGTGFKSTHNQAAIGFFPTNAMEQIPLGHIGWTSYGPALFNQEGMTILLPEIERMLAPFIMAQTGFPYIRGVVHDENRRRVYFLMGYEDTREASQVSARIPDQRIVRHQDAGTANPQYELTIPTELTASHARGAVLVLDYTRNEAWLEDYSGLSGGGTHLGSMYLFRYGGTVHPHPNGWSGQDYDVQRVNALAPVDAMVETQWTELGSPQRKMLTKIEVQMRALDVDEDIEDLTAAKFNPLRISDLWTASTETLHLATLELMVDQHDEVRSAVDIHVLVSEMLARSMEGNRQFPVMRFQVSPRAAGRSFKFRLKNALSTAATAAGHVKGSFRLVDILVEFEVESDTRAAGLTGGAP